MINYNREQNESMECELGGCYGDVSSNGFKNVDEEKECNNRIDKESDSTYSRN